MILSLIISGEVEQYDITKGAEPGEQLVSLRTRRHLQTVSLPGESRTSASQAQPAAPIHVVTNKDIWVIDTVVIDPGHGGKDPGALGPKGTREKDIVLDIALELRKIAEKQKDFKVVLTRSDDRFITLQNRASMATKANGKLFISIHANAAKSRSVSGLEVYFLSEAKEESAKRVAERENASVAFEDNPGYYAKLASQFNENVPKELREIQGDMAYNVFLTESQNMCSILLDSACSATGQGIRGVKQAPFYVMLGTQAAMPSVLFEIGFISNQEEEKLLRRASHRKRLAESIYDSILTFKKLAEKDLITMSGGRQ
jgi:N-acetylmuramoyl-L-alanine amidase